MKLWVTTLTDGQSFSIIDSKNIQQWSVQVENATGATATIVSNAMLNDVPSTDIILTAGQVYDSAPLGVPSIWDGITIVAAGGNVNVAVQV